MAPEQELKEAILGDGFVRPAVARDEPARGRSTGTARRFVRHVGLVLVTRMLLVGAMVTGAWTFMQSDWAQANVIPLQSQSATMAQNAVGIDGVAVSEPVEFR